MLFCKKKLPDRPDPHCSASRLGVFSQILLILQTFDETTQTYDTRQEDIYNIFLEKNKLETAITQNSQNPATSAAIFSHISTLLEQYRRNGVDIPMAEISGLLDHLQTRCHGCICDRSHFTWRGCHSSSFQANGLSGDLWRGAGHGPAIGLSTDSAKRRVCGVRVLIES